jgi:hypothetical protein
MPNTELMDISINAMKAAVKRNMDVFKSTGKA